MYTALMQFKDIDGEIYDAGDTYPREDLTQKRIQQLSTSDNRTGAPVIAMAESTLDQLRQFAAEKGIEIPASLLTADEVKAFLDEAVDYNIPDIEVMDINQLRQFAAEKGIEIPSAVKNPNTARRRIIEAMA